MEKNKTWSVRSCLNNNTVTRSHLKKKRLRHLSTISMKSFKRGENHWKLCQNTNNKKGGKYLQHIDNLATEQQQIYNLTHTK